MGMKPGVSSGKYQKHVDRVLGFDAAKRDLYSLKVPGHSRGDQGSRTEIDMPIALPHELLDQEVERTPGMFLRLQEALDDQSVPPCYDSHPVVEGSTEPVLPLASQGGASKRSGSTGSEPATKKRQTSSSSCEAVEPISLRTLIVEQALQSPRNA